MFALIKDGQVAQYPYSVGQFRQDNPNVSLPEHPTLAQLAEFGVLPVAQTAAPQATPGVVAYEGDPALVGGAWTQQWFTRPATADEAPVVEGALGKVYDDAMLALFETVAKSKRYESWVTCALRAGYPGPFQAEGHAFATWMDTCNAYGYTVMDAVKSGARPLPTVDEFLAELPPMVWPA